MPPKPARWLLRKRNLLAAAIAVAVAVLASLPWLLARPSNVRDWTPNLAVMPLAEFRDSIVTIRNVRNTRYRSVDDYEPRYDDRIYDLTLLDAVWFVVEPFSNWGGAAHTFLTFGFADSQFVAISIEARTERGERYHFLKGLFRRYELIYVVADERDAIGLRANVRGDDVYLYPIRAPQPRIRDLFVAMLWRANELRDRPAFYNTLTSNCTNNIVKHVNALVPDRIPFSFKVLMPGYSDQLAYDLGLIDTELPFDQIRARFRINEQARQYADRADFSIGLRRVEQPAPDSASAAD